MNRWTLLFAIAIASTVGAFAQQTAKATAVLLELSQPVYPSLARVANISGDVSVSVKVRPDGKTEAAFEQGHPMLKQAAVESAQKSRFECRECDSTVTFRLVYSFRLTDGSDCCGAMSRPASVSVDPQPSNANTQSQAHITITADEMCLCDPSAQSTKKRARSPKCFYLWKCSTKTQNPAGTILVLEDGESYKPNGECQPTKAVSPIVAILSI